MTSFFQKELIIGLYRANYQKKEVYSIKTRYKRSIFESKSKKMSLLFLRLYLL